MKIEIENKHIVRESVAIDFTLDIGNDRTLELYKSWEDGENIQPDTDWGWNDEESEKLFMSLSEEDQEEITDFIVDLQ